MKIYIFILSIICLVLVHDIDKLKDSNKDQIDELNKRVSSLEWFNERNTFLIRHTINTNYFLHKTKNSISYNEMMNRLGAVMDYSAEWYLLTDSKTNKKINNTSTMLDTTSIYFVWERNGWRESIW